MRTSLDNGLLITWGMGMVGTRALLHLRQNIVPPYLCWWLLSGEIDARSQLHQLNAAAGGINFFFLFEGYRHTATGEGGGEGVLPKP